MAAAAGTCTVIEEIFDGTKLISWAWTGGTGETLLGACTTTNFYNGKLLFCVTTPSGATVTAPADDYDIMILDKNDIDLLADNGLNRATGTTESILEASLGAVANSQLELNITNSGSAGTEGGYVYVWIR